MSIDVRTVANFFDEVDEDYLVPFDWNPNTKLPNNGRTYRLKDRFIVKFAKKICIYDDIDHCRIKFHSIFRDNIHFVYQCKDMMDKIKVITTAEKYDLISDTRNKNVRAGNTVTSLGSSSGTVTSLDDKDGLLSGSADATSLKTLYNKAKQHIEVENILKPKDTAIMEYLDPNMRQINQSFKYNRHATGSLTQNVTNNSSATLDQLVSSNYNISKIDAANELKALTTTVPRLIEEFLECFNPLFYY